MVKIIPFKAGIVTNSYLDWVCMESLSFQAFNALNLCHPRKNNKIQTKGK